MPLALALLCQGMCHTWHPLLSQAPRACGFCCGGCGVILDGFIRCQSDGGDGTAPSCLSACPGLLLRDALVLGLISNPPVSPSFIPCREGGLQSAGVSQLGAFPAGGCDPFTFPTASPALLRGSSTPAFALFMADLQSLT